ncbi:putative serine/threonine protein kinase [Handroanthus impetiginosus]|uniref:non-specific serine/threonine protein kinase n=1 Tax=Handroanthus impetiginosus TaxID=429701 RepID=A0A2G9GCR8_9LAMI|nr:putative serine/threonine protein kinase [Handroanthus impetiginosus]
MLDESRRNSEDLVSEGLFSSKSSMSSDTTLSHCTSFSRLSFELPMSSPEHPATLKPHRSSDSSFQAIRLKSNLSFRDFSLVRQIGSGDIGRVYLCRLRGTPEEGRLYAMKVVDNDVLALKKKTQRAETERKIMRLLDHPFLPTLYAEFEASHFSCVVMEYCSGGDLHSLRHKQPQKRFSLSSARFYAAEVLVALEYLHMLGIIYRDLKPENVLVRSDGHIMLTDFDLSLCSDAIPAVESPDFSPEPVSSPRASRSSRALTPFSCISDRLFRSKKIQTLASNRLFVAEPVTARSCSFVGTHEYVAPEVATGRSHGNAVDWWAFGIFIYEMIYGRTPFAGVNNEATLRNIAKKPLTFPTDTPRSTNEMHAQDLISGLLNKDPNKRLGSKRGAADVKTHPFFKGLNFALIRSVTPPGVEGIRRQKTTPSRQQTAPFSVF